MPGVREQRRTMQLRAARQQSLLSIIRAPLPVRLQWPVQVETESGHVTQMLQGGDADRVLMGCELEELYSDPEQ